MAPQYCATAGLSHCARDSAEVAAAAQRWQASPASNGQAASSADQHGVAGAPVERGAPLRPAPKDVVVTAAPFAAAANNLASSRATVERGGVMP
jgi:hypothetical protein